MANITLLGVDYPDVPAVQLPLTGGGFATFSEGSGGDGFEYVTSLYDETIKLADTDFATWSPTTTATAILASQNVGTFVATSVKDHDYWSKFRFIVNFAYVDGFSPIKATPIKVVGQNWYAITRRASTIANMQSGNRNYNGADGITTNWQTAYYTSTTANTIALSPSYGIYLVNVAPTLSSASAVSPIVTVKRPTVNARCSSTYMATGVVPYIDQDKTTIRLIQEVYRSTNVGFRRSLLYEEFMDDYQNIT